VYGGIYRSALAMASLSKSIAIAPFFGGLFRDKSCPPCRWNKGQQGHAKTSHTWCIPWLFYVAKEFGDVNIVANWFDVRCLSHYFCQWCVHSTIHATCENWWDQLVSQKIICSTFFILLLVYNPAWCCDILKYLFIWIHMPINCSGSERGSARCRCSNDVVLWLERR
jgi:hypothetical protein